MDPQLPITTATTTTATYLLTPSILRQLIISFQNPQLPFQTRSSLTQQLEEFKNSTNALNVALELFVQETLLRQQQQSSITTNEHDLIRHFCLHVIIHVCKLNWLKRFIPMEKNNLAQTSMMILEQYLIHPTEARYVQQAAISLVIFIVEREAPEAWVEFPTRLLHLLSMSTSHAKTALEILGILSQDCCDAEFSYSLSTSRRMSLMKMLQQLAPSFVPQTLALLNSTTPPHPLILDILNAFSYIFLWLGMGNEGVSQVAIENLAQLTWNENISTEIQMSALQNLQVIVSKKTLAPLRAELLFDALIPCFRIAFQPQSSPNNTNNSNLLVVAVNQRILYVEASVTCLASLVTVHASSLLEAGRDVLNVLIAASSCTSSNFVICIPAWRELIILRKVPQEILKQLVFGIITTYTTLLRGSDGSISVVGSSVGGDSDSTTSNNDGNHGGDEDTIVAPLRSLARDLARLHTVLTCTAIFESCKLIFGTDASTLQQQQQQPSATNSIHTRFDLIPGLTFLFEHVLSGMEPFFLEKFAQCGIRFDEQFFQQQRQQQSHQQTNNRSHTNKSIPPILPPPPLIYPGFSFLDLEVISLLDLSLNIILNGKPIHFLDGLNLIQCCSPLTASHPRGMTFYLDRALSLFCNVLEESNQTTLRRKAVTCLLSMCRRVAKTTPLPSSTTTSSSTTSTSSAIGTNTITVEHNTTNHDKERFTAEVVLPALITRASKLSNLSIVERVRVLESAIVLGSTLPTLDAKLALSREVLAYPFNIFTNQELLVPLLQNIVAVNSKFINMEMDYSWGSRGYLFDMDALPEHYRHVHEAAFLLSTCCQEGAVLDVISRQTITNCAARICKALFQLWQTNNNHVWYLTIHPTDAKIILGVRRAEMVETLMDELIMEGNRLQRGRCAVIAFLSSLRSTCLTLLSVAASISGGGIFNPQDLFDGTNDVLAMWNAMEDRHVADFLMTVGIKAPHLLLIVEILKLCGTRFEQDASSMMSIRNNQPHSTTTTTTNQGMISYHHQQQQRFPRIPNNVPAGERDILNDTCRSTLQAAYVKVALAALEHDSLPDEVLFSSIHILDVCFRNDDGGSGLAVETQTLRGFTLLWCYRLEHVGGSNSNNNNVDLTVATTASASATNNNTALRTFCGMRLIPMLCQSLFHLKNDDNSLRRWFSDLLSDALCIFCYDKPIGKVIGTLPIGSPLFGFGGPSTCGFDETVSKHLENNGLLFLSSVCRMACQCTTTKDFRDLVMDSIIDNIFVDTNTAASSTHHSQGGGKLRSTRRAKKLLNRIVSDSIDMVDSTSSNFATTGGRSGMTSPEDNNNNTIGVDDVADGSLHRLFT
jgi:hypothetical protein